MKPWKLYQEDVAAYFRSLGLEASTDTTINGVRTKHDIDVLVKSHHVGFDITWVVECKFWNTPVSKLHILALREIVADVGADRGIILSESGFQSGAQEAANLTNVRLTSFADIRETARNSFIAMHFMELYDRVESCRERYWNISKGDRIKAGLRPDVGGHGYSGQGAIECCSELLKCAFRGTYPFNANSIWALVQFGMNKSFESPEELIEIVEQLTRELENRLDAYDGNR